MMEKAVQFESLENRKLFAITGPPTFTQLTAVSHSDGVDGGNVMTTSSTDSTATLSTPIDTDSALDISFDTMGHGSLDSNTANGDFIRAAVQITDMTTGQVLRSSDVSMGGPTSDLQRLKTSGGGDDLIVQPKQPFIDNHVYTLQLNQVYTGENANNSNEFLRTVDGVDFAQKTFTFTVNSYVTQPPSGISFTQSTQSTTGTNSFTAITIGPDGRLYAATTTGVIDRFDISSSGALTNQTTINTILDNNQTSSDPNGNRIITGIAFSPTASASDPLVMYVSHGAYQFGNDGTTGTGVEDYAPNFSGKISTISGDNLQNYEDLVVNIPRSVKDHMNNDIVFSPNGKAIYFGLAAMNAMGGSNDSVWGGRLENIYSGTILQLRLGSASNGINPYLHTYGAVNLLLDNVNGNGATGIDPATGATVGTHYNIYKGSNPLRIYADGIRNDFDMVFASNGHLYAAINGSSAGGNTPATPTDLDDVPTQNRLDKGTGATPLPYSGPSAPALQGVNLIEQDDLIDVTNGAYYGHPDPARGEYVLDAGNPTGSTSDPYTFPGNGTDGYAVGQEPDRNYTEPIYDFGDDQSPDGIIQYKAVNGVNTPLDGSLVVARYSSGGDLLGLTLNSSGGVSGTQAGITGLTNLVSPLDVVENMKTGDMYATVLTDETGVSANSGSIVLLKAPAAAPSTGGTATASTAKISVYVTPGTSGASKSVMITNTGTGNLVLDRDATKITSSTGDRGNFVVSNLPVSNLTIAPGDAITLEVTGVLAKGQTGTKKAHLAVSLNDPALPGGYLIVSLYATDSAAAETASVASPASLFASGSLIGSKLSASSVMSQLSTKDTVDSLLS